ncbi:hypothetical protein [Paraburkholderia aspalathi]|uniref:hypothetical protein n=1 Tax=Paraburkholderia aspalathi TaxID=1324617 RepID=UPI001B14A527|nr:hypothetical protein [Paraburkholderia aspalathi]CAE6852634.1 hypothetical protein R20943_07646 [Paraburkholderia aspalathi]
MNDTADARKTKERSPNFPFIPLEPALQRAQVLYSHERRGSAPAAAVAKHWGYTESSSAFKQTVAALKSYGLLIDEGGSSGRMVRLTETALRILLDQRPDTEEKASFIRNAALNPAVASEVFKRWPDGLPSEHTLSHYLMFDRGFQEETAMRVVKILRLNDAFANISHGAEPYYGTDAPIEEQFGAPLAQTQPENDIARVVPTPMRPSPEPVAYTQSARSEKIIDPNDLDVTINFSGEPTQETYEFLADYIELRLKQFQRKAARSAVTSAHEPGNDLA